MPSSLTWICNFWIKKGHFSASILRNLHSKWRGAISSKWWSMILQRSNSLWKKCTATNLLPVTSVRNSSCVMSRIDPWPLAWFSARSICCCLMSFVIKRAGGQMMVNTMITQKKSATKQIQDSPSSSCYAAR